MICSLLFVSKTIKKEINVFTWKGVQWLVRCLDSTQCRYSTGGMDAPRVGGICSLWSVGFAGWSSTAGPPTCTSRGKCSLHGESRVYHPGSHNLSRSDVSTENSFPKTTLELAVTSSFTRQSGFLDTWMRSGQVVNTPLLCVFRTQNRDDRPQKSSPPMVFLCPFWPGWPGLWPMQFSIRIICTVS
jgi:hypothetical protein